MDCRPLRTSQWWSRRCVRRGSMNPRCHTVQGASLLVMGGYGPAISVPRNEVWRSTDGGASWTQRPAPPWQARHAACALVLQASRDHESQLRGVHDSRRCNSHAVLYALRCNVFGRTIALPDSPRTSHARCCSPCSMLTVPSTSRPPSQDGTVLLAGGWASDGSKLNDVWVGSPAGDDWVQHSDAAWGGIGARAGHACVVLVVREAVPTALAGVDAPGESRMDLFLRWAGSARTPTRCGDPRMMDGLGRQWEDQLPACGRHAIEPERLSCRCVT